MSHLKKIISILGRICFSAIFILAGIGKITNWEATQQSFVNAILDIMSHTYSIDWLQDLFDVALKWATPLLVLATIVELLGGLLIFLGIQVRFGALVLCLFLIPVTFVFHCFWYLQGSEREIQMIMFLKNLSIFGGGLTLIAFGKGPKKQDIG